MPENLSLRRSIAAAMLGGDLDADGFARCPGEAKHTARTGPRDFCVRLDGAPTGFCFHDSCAGEVEAFNLELRRRIARAEADGRPGPPAVDLGAGVAPVPRRPRKPKRPAFDPAALEALARRCPVPARELSEDWLRARSPVPVPAPEEQGRETAAAFLAALYGPGEAVLVFTRQTSQGCFAWHGGRSFRLGDAPGVRAVPSALPTGGAEGVWFLAQPVTGKWQPSPYARGGPPKLGRRHGGCVTAWRFLVIESDTAPPALWLPALVQMPLPVAAIFTSGGRSIHALAQVEADTKAAFDALRDSLLPVLCPLGADGAAMTAVRLSRLPGMLRHGTRGKDGAVIRYEKPRLQRLIYLNPGAPVAPISELI